jgi:hypothetical protein
MRGARAIAGEDGSSGAITGSVAEAVHVVRELLGKEPLGEDEPLLRARFLDYLPPDASPQPITRSAVIAWRSPGAHPVRTPQPTSVGGIGCGTCGG